MEHRQQTYCQFQTLLPSMPHLSKLHSFAINEECGTQDEGLRAHEARQQQGAQRMEGQVSNWPLHARGAC